MKTINNPDTKISFGKYKGLKTIGELIAENPKYIGWCIEHLDWFKLSEQLENDLIENLETFVFHDDDESDQYYDWRYW